jgi:amidohydrolase
VPEGKLNISLGPAASACAGFRITITGSGTHGAMPDRGVDPINIGVHIYLALQSIVSRETPLIDGSLITIGSFNAGDAANVIPQTAVLQGTMRSFNNKTREFVINRIRETVLSTAETFRGKARFEILSDIPCVMNDTAFSEKICSYISGIKDLPLEIIHSDPFLGSEDFAFVANAVPSAMVFIGAPPADKTRCFPQHHPKVVFDENVLPSGAAVYAESGFRWLEENG